MPTSEVQVRPLAKLEPQQQQEAKGEFPSGIIVKDVVDRIQQRIKVPNPYHLGEIYTLLLGDRLSNIHDDCARPTYSQDHFNSRLCQRYQQAIER